MSVGPIIVAFITASITQTLQLSEDEQFLLNKMDLNHLRCRVLESAARIIQLWWRRKRFVAFGSVEERRISVSYLRRRRSSVYSRTSKGLASFEEEKDRLYRTFYLDIEALRRFHQSNLPLAEQHRQSAAIASPPRPASPQHGSLIDRHKLPTRQGQVGGNEAG